jgi:septum formation protein
MPNTQTLVLGSSSTYRHDLLERLGQPFEVLSPDIDEIALPSESASALVQRLSVAKARAVAVHKPDARIIGSDQVAVVSGQITGKPHTHERAVAQLQRASGEEVTFLTGLCLLNARTGIERVEVCPIHVGFRHLTNDEIENYLHLDQPYNCAGSIRAEGAGVALLRYIRTDDPSALIGLPLIALARMLRDDGAKVI